jgi:hypothetical protein
MHTDAESNGKDKRLNFTKLGRLVGRSYWTIRNYALTGVWGVKLDWEWDISQRITTLAAWEKFRQAVKSAREGEDRALKMAAEAALRKPTRAARAAKERLERIGAR